MPTLLGPSEATSTHGNRPRRPLPSKSAVAPADRQVTAVGRGQITFSFIVASFIKATRRNVISRNTLLLIPALRRPLVSSTVDKGRQGLAAKRGPQPLGDVTLMFSRNTFALRHTFKVDKTRTVWPFGAVIGTLAAPW